MAISENDNECPLLGAPPDGARSWEEWCEERALAADGGKAKARDEADQEIERFYQGRAMAFRDVAKALKQVAQAAPAEAKKSCTECGGRPSGCPSCGSASLIDQGDGEVACEGCGYQGRGGSAGRPVGQAEGVEVTEHDDGFGLRWGPWSAWVLEAAMTVASLRRGDTLEPAPWTDDDLAMVRTAADEAWAEGNKLSSAHLHDIARRMAGRGDTSTPPEEPEGYQGPVGFDALAAPKVEEGPTEDRSEPHEAFTVDPEEGNGWAARLWAPDGRDTFSSYADASEATHALVDAIIGRARGATQEPDSGRLAEHLKSARADLALMKADRDYWKAKHEALASRVWDGTQGHKAAELARQEGLVEGYQMAIDHLAEANAGQWRDAWLRRLENNPNRPELDDTSRNGR